MITLFSVQRGFKAIAFNAIRGRGAFRYFKDKIHEYGIADDWYKYRDDELREIAIAWCEEHGISHTE